MNRYSSIFVSFTAGAALLTACDEIKEDDRYIELPMVEAQRAVLLEDFTGQRCVNCPDAHEVIHTLTEQYGEEALIAVAIHPAGNSLVLNYTPGARILGLGTQEGARIAEMSGIQASTSLPIGCVNRATGLIGREAWGAAVRNQLEEPTVLAVGLEVAGEGETSRSLTVKAAATENFSGRINAWIIEDDIVAVQITPSGTDANYVHNHVFRTSVTPVDGESVAIQESTIVENENGELERGISYEKTYPVEIDSSWDIANCRAVVFFTNPDGTVEQAHTVGLVPSATE